MAETTEAPAFIATEETAALDALQNTTAIQSSAETMQVLSKQEDSLKTNVAEEKIVSTPSIKEETIQLCFG